MNKEEFLKKYNHPSFTDTQDVLMTIASNLSNLQNQGSDVWPIETKDLINKLETLKEYIFDYKKVIKNNKNK